MNPAAFPDAAVTERASAGNCVRVLRWLVTFDVLKWVGAAVLMIGVLADAFSN